MKARRRMLSDVLEISDPNIQELTQWGAKCELNQQGQIINAVIRTGNATEWTTCRGRRGDFIVREEVGRLSLFTRTEFQDHYELTEPELAETEA